MQINKINKSIILMIVAITLSACNNESEIFETGIETRDAITDIIEDFKSGINIESRADFGFQVVSVDTKYYKINEDTIVESLPTKSDDSVFDISTVKIKVDNSEGFVILSTDERLHKIFYYTENGNLSDTVNIAPLKEYIDMVPFFAADEIIDHETALDTKATVNEDILINSIVPFKWGQNYPFNNLTPECNCSNCGGHMPIGCVTTASAQTLATIGSFNSTLYGSKDIDFKKLPRYSNYMTTAQQQQISHYFYEVALCCQIKFECGGSGSSIKAAYQYFKDLGYKCSYKEGGIDCQQLISELQKGYPHMIAGRNSSGHMWIVDGFRSSGSSTYFSCNWGWNGYCDGWVDGNPYTVHYPDNSTKSFSKNLRHIYIESKPI